MRWPDSRIPAVGLAVVLAAFAAVAAGCRTTPDPAPREPEVRLSPTPVEGELIARRQFEVWLKPAPEAAETKVGLMFETEYRTKDGLLVHVTEAKTILGRGTSVLTNWNKTTFVEDAAGKPVRFAVVTINNPGRQVRSYEGRIEGAKMRLISGAGGDTRTREIDVPAGTTTLPAMRRALIDRGLTVGLTVEGLAFPVPEEPEKPHPAVMKVTGRETATFAGKPVELFAVLTGRQLFSDARGEPVWNGETVYMDARGETHRIEGNQSGGGKIVIRRVK